MSQISVVILGAGLGGLTLGRCLRQKGISSVLYERASSAPRHTYGITLESWAYRPLLKTLDLDEQAFRRRIAVDSLYRGGTGKVASDEEDGISTSFRACRHKLESLLREGQVINLEHSLSSAKLLPDESKAELSFQNGLKLTPTLVVDMMGVHSQLRKSLLPDVTLKVLPFAVFSSKRYLSDSLFHKTYGPAFSSGNTLILPPQQPRAPRLEITVNEHMANGSISISYVYSRAARPPPEHDALHNPERPIAGATDIPEEFFEELSSFIESRKPDQPFPDAFDTEQIHTERLLHWLMRTVLVPEDDLRTLLRHGVVLIGDSAHATPILGGCGANYAISDAVELAEVIEKSGSTRGPIQRFYDEHWQKWRAEVEESEARIAEMHKVPKASL